MASWHCGKDESGTNLSRRKKVDAGDALKGSVMDVSRDQSDVRQILTDLSSD